MKRQFRLTKKLIDALPPCPADAKTREVEYSDADVAGLRLVVNRLGRKSWLLRYTHADAKRSMKLGDYPGVDISEARQRAVDARSQLARGIDPQAREVVIVKEALTLTAFMEKEYLPHAKAQQRSYRDTLGRWNHHIKPVFGHLPVKDIRTQEVQRFHDKKKVDLSPATANRILATFKRALNLCVLWQRGGLEKNPVTGVRMHAENNQRERYLAGAELKRFMAALDKEPSRTAAAAIKFLLATGVRRNEALTARFSDMDLSQATWRLTHTKNGHARVVYLNETAMNIVHEQKKVARWDWVFPRKGGADAHLADPKKAFKRVLARAGISGIVLHSLRHSYASWVVQSTGSLPLVSSLLGHRQLGGAVTARYSHLAASQMREANAHVSLVMDDACK